LVTSFIKVCIEIFQKWFLGHLDFLISIQTGFFFLGYVRDYTYSKKCPGLEELKAKIREAVEMCHSGNIGSSLTGN
jgi:hypothetical protein